MLIDTKSEKEQLTHRKHSIIGIKSTVTITTIHTASLIIRIKATITKLLCGKTCTLSALQATVH